MLKQLFFVVLCLLVTDCKKKNKTIDTTAEIPAPLPDGVKPNIPIPAKIDPNWVSTPREESDILEVLGVINSNDRLNTRFLTTCEQFNQGNKDLTEFTKAIDKSLNSLSDQRQIELSKGTGLTGCARSFDLRDYGMTRQNWEFFVAELHRTFGKTFESFTTRGILIKQLTQSVQASIPASIFMSIAHNQPVYSNMLGLPATESELEAFLDVDLQDNFDTEDRNTHLFGVTQSPISITKPRLGLATESGDGFYYKTYDILIGSVGQNTTNPFESPFPVQARSVRTLAHDGSESIFSLPNGLIGFYLSNGLGNQVDFAPLDLVTDPVAAGRGLNPTITYLSCLECHKQAIIPVDDEIAKKVETDPSYGIDDRQKVEFWHGRSQALSAKIRQDTALVFETFDKMGIGKNENDQINAYTNLIRSESNLEQVAALMRQKPDDFARSLRSTIQSLQEIGQLLNGDTVTLDQLQKTLQVYVVEANIFRDDFGE